MLALIDNQIMRAEPADLDGDFSVEVVKPNIKGIGRVVVKFAGEILNRGVEFFVMGPRDNCGVDPVTGQFALKKGTSATIRAIFGGQHRDVHVQ